MNERSCDVCPSQAMAASLSSLDLEQVTGREGRDDLGGSDMTSVAAADSGRITAAEDGAGGSQGLSTSCNDMATGKVRGAPSHETSLLPA
jgi:hypothetical protein